MSDGQIHYDQWRREYVVDMTFTESERGDLAGAFGSTDGFSETCDNLALELHRLNHPEDDA